MNAIPSLDDRIWQAVTDCSVCAFGYDLSPVKGALVFCAAQNATRYPAYCCTGFRRITEADMRDRVKANFGTSISQPCGSPQPVTAQHKHGD